MIKNSLRIFRAHISHLPSIIITQIQKAVLDEQAQQKRLLIELFLPIVVGLGMGGLFLFSRTLDPKWSKVAIAVVFGVACIFLVDVAYGSKGKKINYLKKLFLMALIIDVPLGFDIAPGTIENHQGGPAGLEISLMTFVIVIGYALWFLEKKSSTSSSKPVRYFPLVTVPALLFLVSNFLSFFQSQFMIFSIYEMVMVTQFFLFYFYFINHLDTEEDLKLVLLILVSVLIVEGVLMSAQKFSGFEFDIGILKTYSQVADDGSTRVGGTLGGASGAGTWLMSALAVTLGILINKYKLVNLRLAAIAAGIGSVALVATGSRAGWLALAMGIIVLGLGTILFTKLRRSIETKIVTGLIVGGIVMSPFFAGTIIHRFTADDSGSTESRKPLAALAFNMIEDHPYGVGLNNYGEVMFSSQYVPPSLIGSSSIYPVHNKYLLVWAETGPWGMVIFISLILAGLFTTIRLILNKNAPPHLIILSLTLFASLVGYAQNMNTEPFGTRQRAQFLWLLLALLVGVYNLAMVESKKESKTVVEQPISGRQNLTTKYGVLN